VSVTTALWDSTPWPLTQSSKVSRNITTGITWSPLSSKTLVS
jgi:hypothetical protein